MRFGRRRRRYIDDGSDVRFGRRRRRYIDDGSDVNIVSEMCNRRPC